MSWHRIVLPLTRVDVFNTETSPDVVNIGKLGWACFEKENKPQGFAMFHATEKIGKNETWIVYLSPVAAELCTEIKESYTLEPCEVPARDEPDMAFVFGDPLVMGRLQDSYQAKLANQAKVANSAT